MGFFKFYISAVVGTAWDCVSYAQSVIFVAAVMLALFRGYVRDPSKLHVALTGIRAALFIFIALFIVRFPVKIYDMWSFEHERAESAEGKADALPDREITASQAQKFTKLFSENYAKIGSFPIIYAQTSDESGRYSEKIMELVFSITKVRPIYAASVRAKTDKGILD